MKYWEIIADNLSKARWSLGYVSAIDSEGQTIWIADAHKHQVHKSGNGGYLGFESKSVNRSAWDQSIVFWAAGEIRALH